MSLLEATAAVGEYSISILQVAPAASVPVQTSGGGAPPKSPG